MNISKDEKSFLLKLARCSIKSLFSEVKLPQPDFEKLPILREKAGAFVTLTISGNLRGCIGYIVSDDELHETVEHAAKQASVNDPRFPSLTEGELDLIDLEISVLSPPFKMNSYEEIVLGKHGLIVNEGLNRGLLLPQVPIEHNLDKDQYLSAVCNKAGLPANSWKEKLLNIEMFTATIFSEKELENANG